MENYQEDEDVKKIEFTKIQFNVPKDLLKEFETIRSLKHYSRVEAFKEAMRVFIRDMTPEEYVNQDDMKNQWRQIMDAIYEVSQDPKYKQLTTSEQQVITQQSAGTAFEKVLKKQQTES